jgi:hypothetical protein
LPSPRSPLALAAGLALAFSGTAVAATSVHQSAAGRALARAALLKRSDLGPGWSAGTVPASVAALTCPAFNPHVAGVTLSGDASSPPFTAGTSGNVVSQTAYVYGTRAQASSVAKAVMRRGLLRCVAQGLVAGSSHGVTFTVARRQLYSLTGIGVKSAGFRVSGTATRTDQTVNAYLDVLVLTRGRTVTAISFASLEVPFDTRIEVRLARVVASRIKGT